MWFFNRKYKESFEILCVLRYYTINRGGGSKQKKRFLLDKGLRKTGFKIESKYNKKG